MNDIEQKLLLYDDLPPEEQEEVERYVQVHPEWTALLAEARALRALLRSTHDDDAAPDATDIADYVVARALGKRRPPPEYAARYARVEAALAADPALERQAREMLKTLEQVAAEAEDPMAQFERLTGRRLEARAPAAPTAPAPRVLRWQPLRLALAACLALGVLYGALALASRLAQPERALLADLGDLPDDYGGLRLRGDAPVDRTSERYALALDGLKDARESVLGLFPSYDDEALDAVADRLREVVDASGPDSWEGLEALYVLGKIRLYQGQDEEATWALQSVVALEGPHASEARRLLDYLQQEGLETTDE
ncbi:MAG TPA: hypothetical protein VK002_09325 [Rubricoccaceae bacterium]|jgi:anti-sigma factor RsiW|nr:hypothetical protein [Rubricoccaceae bacterium]